MQSLDSLAVLVLLIQKQLVNMEGLWEAENKTKPNLLTEMNA